MSKQTLSRAVPDRRLTILHVIPTLGVGGAERWLGTLGRALQRRGHEIHVAALWEPYTLADEFERMGLRVFRLDVPHRRLFPVAISRLRSIMCRCRYDVVNGHLLFGSLYARFVATLAGGRVAILSTMYNLGYDSYPANNVWRRLGKLLDGWSARRFDDIAICVSRGVEAHYRAHLGLMRTHVLPLGVTLDTIARQPSGARDTVRRVLALDASFLIINPARFVPEKGHTYLIDSLRILKSAYGFAPRVLLVGDGPVRPGVEQAVRDERLEDQVILLAPVAHDQLMDWMAGADLMVLPSTHDGCPTVVIEAMALGVPVVASAVGGILDQIESGVSGLLVPPADPDSLAGAIWRVATDETLRDTLIRNARSRVEQFSADELARRYEAVCVELLTKGRAGFAGAAASPEARA